MLEQVWLARRHPEPVADITVQETFARLGATEWDKLREQLSKAALASARTNHPFDEPFRVYSPVL
jgi:hypothetical protein